MVYDKVLPDTKFSDREQSVEDFWKKNDIFKRSLEKNKDGKTYTFYDGPPTANGKPHIGHVLTRVIKDMIPRYRTMKGYYVPRKAGWDTHGLPVELEVEKELGLDGKEQIEKYGVEPFIKKCRESVWKYKGMWEEFSSKVGFWADMDNPYITYENDYIESEWWALKEIFKKGLLYKGYKIVPYCPRCGTPLSSHEVAQGYKEVNERSAIVRFKAKDEDLFYLVWTTTPWTLPSNVALCVNPDEKYIKVKAADGHTYILAKELADKVLEGVALKNKPDLSDEDKDDQKKADYSVLEEFSGSELEHREYEPLFECSGKVCAGSGKKSHFITCDNYVTMSDGTGIVHIAPAFGEDDSRIGKDYDLPVIQLVDTSGNLTSDTPYDGMFVKDADPVIIKDLKMAGKLFSATKFTHDYPFCWRCDTPLIYYARESWFIRMTDVKDDLIKNNKTINWIPETIGTGRFGTWLENIQDWGISRDRYWGTPLNVWKCDDCGDYISVGSIKELKERSESCPDDIELHRPYIDKITVKCDKCGGTAHRVPEVIDCWFDSGSMPFAQHHYPFENEELFKEQFPAQFISEAVDQTRGWFYSLLAISTLLFNKAPYENVIVLGHVLDEDGVKMSKSKGNAVDPMDALAKHGADAIRWYFYENSMPWLPNRFYDKAVSEGQRKFLSTLWNTYSFYILYANIDIFSPSDHKFERDTLNVMDRWILSRLQTVIKETDEYLEDLRITEAARCVEAFTDELSNWYVRRCRERFWAPGMEQDKVNAYMTLYTAIKELIKLSAPMIPFMTESIYQNLVRNVDKNAPDSIHLCDYPESDDSFTDANLEKNMGEVLKIVVLGRACRNATGIKTRQPIGKMFICAPFALDDFYTEIISEELNVKNVEWKTDVSEYTKYTFKPQLKTLGPKYGKMIGKIKEYLESIDGSKAMSELNETGVLKFSLDDNDFEIAKEDLLISMTQAEGFTSDSSDGITVVFDTKLTDDLIDEGFFREVVSKLQTMRKEAGFEVMDMISVWIDTDDNSLIKAITKYEDRIKKIVLADNLILDECNSSGAFKAVKDINDIDVKMAVERLG